MKFNRHTESFDRTQQLMFCFNHHVTGEGLCNGTDATLIRHAAVGNVSALFGQNCPNALL